uniref:Phenylpyruvate decarboxylase n=1 Tax=Pichia kudriavzevii TaxID=4909 RepID=A0A8F1NJ38_PICKU|nr:phenylpyruvate decarboxylase [Pichia kudriavzevii]
MLQTANSEVPNASQITIDAASGLPADKVLPNITNTEITISEYIFYRILQLGVRSVFGVPGDFNLRFLEHIYDVHGLNWIGCCNELNAAYAADAYAKASKKMGVLLTTYGVGELSALNGVAGAYTEFAPVLHLVGTSALKFKRNPRTLNLHHLAGDKKTFKKSDHYKYERIASEFSVDSASIEDDPIEACEMIDRVIYSTWRESRPGYIFLPCDLSEMKVDAQRLASPIELTYRFNSPVSRVEGVADQILQLIYQNKNVSIIVDGFIRKFRMESEFYDIMEKFGDKVNIFSTMYGKGLIGEEHPRFVGTYFGKYEKAVGNLLEASDLIIHFGNFDHELNMGGFTFNIPQEKYIDLSAQYVDITGNLDESITMMEVLPVLASKLDSSRVNVADKFEKFDKYYETPDYQREASLQETDIMQSLNENLTGDDILIVETCSFLFAVPDLKVKQHTNIILQAYWASIGYALPATLGASLAIRDFNLSGKVYTIEGDGSAQMSLQELSSMLRYNIDATMILLNNSGYTIERVIVGPHSSYNDINTNWQWTDLLRAFGDVANEKSVSYTIKEREQLLNILSDPSFKHNGKFRLLECVLPMFDVPKKLGQFTGKIPA